MGTVALCPRCGHGLPDKSHFCPGCGFDLHDGRPRLATGLLPTNQLLQRRYMILRRLAQGGQSAVYLVSDTIDGTQRALKEMSESNLSPTERESAVNDFIREARMLSTLSHPALARVYENFVEGQKQYLVMEYVEGKNLEDELIEEGRPLDWNRVVAWGMDLCDVLAYLHSRQPPIIYRDLKPANVMLTPSGKLKLIDFGIARWLHTNRSHDTAQLGTDGYAPLEQYSARSEPRSDLYALGASMYHLLTGRVPESAPARVGGQSLTPLRSINPLVPEAIERVVLRALSLQARERYADANQMLDALMQAARGVHGGNTGHIPRVQGVPTVSGRLGAVASPGVGRGSGRAGQPSDAPRLYVWPLRMDAGMLEMEEIITLPLTIANHGGGQLTGSIETNLASLSVEPRAIKPGVDQLMVRIDTTGLRPGPYTCHVGVRTSGGDQIVPVRFQVRPPRGMSQTSGRFPAV